MFQDLTVTICVFQGLTVTICVFQDLTVTICVFQDLTVTICVFQDLTVTIVADRPHTEVQLVEDTEEPSSINTQSFVDEQEWT